MKRTIFACLFLALAGAIPSSAGEPALPGKVAEAGDELINDDFSGAELGEAWAAAKGSWVVKDGALAGSELESDQHAAVLNLQVPVRNAIVEFDVTLGTAQGFNLSFNHAKGHLWRVYLSEEGLKLQKDKDKKAPASKTEVLATAEVALDPAKTYRVVAEFSGPEVLVRLADGSATVGGSHPSLDTDKPNVRFVMRGEGLVLDNVKVWKAKS